MNTNLFSGQVSLVHTARPSMQSVNNHPTRPVIAFPLPTQRDGLPEPGLRPATPKSGSRKPLADLLLWPVFRSVLRPSLEGLSQRAAESCSSLSYGLHVRLRLLPPRLTATQLPSASESGHLSDRACFHAHYRRLPRRRFTQS